MQFYADCQEFFALAKRADEHIADPVFRHPVETPHFLILPPGPSRPRFGACRFMPAKYEMCGLDHTAWANYVTLARNPEEEGAARIVTVDTLLVLLVEILTLAPIE
jgi:hypothetical protein